MRVRVRGFVDTRVRGGGRDRTCIWQWPRQWPQLASHVRWRYQVRGGGRVASVELTCGLARAKAAHKLRIGAALTHPLGHRHAPATKTTIAIATTTTAADFLGALVALVLLVHHCH